MIYHYHDRFWQIGPRFRLVFGTALTATRTFFIINTSAVRFPIVFKFGRPLRYETFETNFEHPLLVKSNMADSGPKYKKKLTLFSTKLALLQRSRHGMEQDR